jgi:hypothetical protein
VKGVDIIAGSRHAYFSGVRMGMPKYNRMASSGALGFREVESECKRRTRNVDLRRMIPRDSKQGMSKVQM